MTGQAADAADDGGHAERDVADVVAAVLHSRNGQYAALVERDAVNDIADGDADGETGAGFLLDDLSPGALRATEQLVRQAVGPARIFVERQTTDGGARPD